MARVLILIALGAIISQPAMAADVASGARVFKAQCSLCHATTAVAPPGVGPTLAGVVGRRAGSQSAYAARYSPAMRGLRRIWTPDSLRAYIASPAKVVPGNHMPYAGLHNPAQVADIVAYLATLRK